MIVAAMAVRTRRGRNHGKPFILISTPSMLSLPFSATAEFHKHQKPFQNLKGFVSLVKNMLTSLMHV